MKLKLLLCSAAFAAWSTGVSAQTCATAPTCSELGFTSSVASCVGSDMVKCPFDKTKVFCRQTKSCAELGFNKTTTQCSGKKTFVCPADSSKVACDDSAMIGEIKLWPTATVPKGWRLCDGSSLSKTSYSALYNVIGTTYGGSGSYFYLPNLKGRVPVGVGSSYGGTSYSYTLGETGGENFTTLSSDQIPDHKHLTPYSESHTSVPWGYYGSSKWGSHGGADNDNRWYLSSYMYSRTGYRSAPSSKTSGWGSSGSCSSERTYSCSTSPHENRQPYLVLYYIIYTGVY